MKIIRASDCRRERWKNGGGWTREIARGRIGSHGAFAASDLAADWDWRLSVADIERDGPFSNFDGVDRTLVLIQGHGMRLRFADGECAALTPDRPRIDFAGEQELDCALIDGPTRDFNLMSRRDACRVRLGTFGFVELTQSLREMASVNALYLLSGTLRIVGHELSPGDTVMFGTSDTSWNEIECMADGNLLFVRIDPLTLV